MFSNWVWVIVGVAAATISATLVQPEWKIYYNITTNQPIDLIGTNNPRSQLYKTKAALPKILRIGFGPVPCSCQDLTCGCCAGINVTTFDFDKKACMNFTYDPYDFALMMDMIMDDESVFSQQISGKNPPPACIPVPLSIPFAPAIDLCVKIFEVHTPGYNLFMCIDFETRVAQAPILILHFDCMQLGADGIHYLKPEDAQTGPDIEEPDSGPHFPSHTEVYDVVFEEDMKNKTMQKENTTMKLE